MLFAANSIAYGRGLENATLKDTLSIDVERIQVYNQFNQPVLLDDSINYLVVLKSRKYCEDCFREINAFVRAKKEFMNARFISISLIDSTTLDRKKAFSRNQTLMPDFDDSYFQYINAASNTLFKKFQTIYSPELLVINKGRIHHIPYAQIFQYSTSDLNYELKQILINLLK